MMFQKLFLPFSKYDMHIDGYQITIPIFLGGLMLKRLLKRIDEHMIRVAIRMFTCPF